MDESTLDESATVFAQRTCFKAAFDGAQLTLQTTLSGSGACDFGRRNFDHGASASDVQEASDDAGKRKQTAVLRAANPKNFLCDGLRAFAFSEIALMAFLLFAARQKPGDLMKRREVVALIDHFAARIRRIAGDGIQSALFVRQVIQGGRVTRCQRHLPLFTCPLTP